ncbi:hypothetical protein BCV70DRAFT_1431 [Testicularia cyperi]|uniref:Uncharacterized protein n=1 Tax=Testicularia cyperi TaxID=1882483 RepID=A0A317XX93_9BASI|nr:hypothetical protein BCV70DRAFT_1431 [Testicularia cyperi]
MYWPGSLPIEVHETLQIQSSGSRGYETTAYPRETSTAGDNKVRPPLPLATIGDISVHRFERNEPSPRELHSAFCLDEIRKVNCRQDDESLESVIVSNLPNRLACYAMELVRDAPKKGLSVGAPMPIVSRLAFTLAHVLLGSENGPCCEPISVADAPSCSLGVS